MADPQVDPHPTGLPPIVPADVPPSVEGIEQPVIIPGNDAEFPTFTPIVPPPVFGEGGGEPPDFPPAPPDTVLVPIPPGVLVGPVVAPAAVPPSVAGIEQPVLWPSGSQIDWPGFSTAFPTPTIVLTNLFMDGSVPPPQTPTTANILLGGWGPGAGPQEPPPVEPEPEPEPDPEVRSLSAAAMEPRRRRRKSV